MSTLLSCLQILSLTHTDRVHSHQTEDAQSNPSSPQPFKFLLKMKTKFLKLCCKIQQKSLKIIQVNKRC